MEPDGSGDRLGFTQLGQAAGEDELDNTLLRLRRRLGNLGENDAGNRMVVEDFSHGIHVCGVLDGSLRLEMTQVAAPGGLDAPEPPGLECPAIAAARRRFQGKNRSIGFRQSCGRSQTIRL